MLVRCDAHCLDFSDGCWRCCAGLIGCFLLCIILGACEAFTMYVLSKFAERYQAPTYSGLIRKALGRKLSASEPQAFLMLSGRPLMSQGSSVLYDPFAPCERLPDQARADR